MFNLNQTTKNFLTSSAEKKAFLKKIVQDKVNEDAMPCVLNHFPTAVQVMNGFNKVIRDGHICYVLKGIFYECLNLEDPIGPTDEDCN